jgi:hypothetical protein
MVGVASPPPASAPGAHLPDPARSARSGSPISSQLYAEALAEYLAPHAPDEVTEAMNQVVERLDGPGPEPFLADAARRLLERAEW